MGWQGAPRAFFLKYIQALFLQTLTCGGAACSVRAVLQVQFETASGRGGGGAVGFELPAWLREALESDYDFAIPAQVASFARLPCSSATRVDAPVEFCTRAHTEVLPFSSVVQHKGASLFNPPTPLPFQYPLACTLLLG
jgi:hypothetical protein